MHWLELISVVFIINTRVLLVITLGIIMEDDLGQDRQVFNAPDTIPNTPPHLQGQNPLDIRPQAQHRQREDTRISNQSYEPASAYSMRDHERVSYVRLQDLQYYPHLNIQPDLNANLPSATQYPDPHTGHWQGDEVLRQLYSLPRYHMLAYNRASSQRSSNFVSLPCSTGLPTGSPLAEASFQSQRTPYSSHMSLDLHTNQPYQRQPTTQPHHREALSMEWIPQAHAALSSASRPHHSNMSILQGLAHTDTQSQLQHVFSIPQSAHERLCQRSTEAYHSGASPLAHRLTFPTEQVSSQQAPKEYPTMGNEQLPHRIPPEQANNPHGNNLQEPSSNLFAPLYPDQMPSPASSTSESCQWQQLTHMQISQNTNYQRPSVICYHSKRNKLPTSQRSQAYQHGSSLAQNCPAAETIDGNISLHPQTRGVSMLQPTIKDCPIYHNQQMSYLQQGISTQDHAKANRPKCRSVLVVSHDQDQHAMSEMSETVPTHCVVEPPACCHDSAFIAARATAEAHAGTTPKVNWNQQQYPAGRPSPLASYQGAISSQPGASHGENLESQYSHEEIPGVSPAKAPRKQAVNLEPDRIHLSNSGPNSATQLSQECPPGPSGHSPASSRIYRRNQPTQGSSMCGSSHPSPQPSSSSQLNIQQSSHPERQQSLMRAEQGIAASQEVISPGAYQPVTQDPSAKVAKRDVSTISHLTAYQAIRYTVMSTFDFTDVFVHMNGLNNQLISYH